MCGSCPGFFPSGIKDPAQWDGVNLTAAAKVAWRALIKDFDLPLPRETHARPTPF
jgi:lysophospholipase L1-like esterase